VALIVELRTRSADQGLDAGCDIIAWHLETRSRYLALSAVLGWESACDRRAVRR